MGRIREMDRLTVVDVNIAHWTQTNLHNGTPIEIVPGFGLPQLQALRDAYAALGDEIFQLEQSELPFLRAERDSLFGSNNKDMDGVWFRLLQYKMLVKSKLGLWHPLTKTIPDLGKVQPSRLLKILDRYIDHWQRVNAALAEPLVIGDLTLEALIQRHDDIEAKIEAIEEIEFGLLPLKRAERELLFGDVAEDDREPTSIIARLLLYHITIRTMFPGKLIAASLPEIFPGHSPTSTLPTFRFNFAQTGASHVELWIEMIAGLVDAQTLYLREGTAELAMAVSLQPGQVWKTAWQNVVIVEGVDEVVLRNGRGIDIARGVFDPTLAEPGP